MDIFKPKKQIKKNNNYEAKTFFTKINFYLLDYYQNLKNINNIENDENKDAFYLFITDNDKITQKIYSFKDFTQKYYFIMLINKMKTNKIIGVLLSRIKYFSFNEINIKINCKMEIISSPLITEISRDFGISLLNNWDIYTTSIYHFKKDKFCDLKFYIIGNQFESNNSNNMLLNYKTDITIIIER